MNKQQFRSAYSKIALSEEFKETAKKRLMSLSQEEPDVIDDQSETVKTMRLETKQHKPWKTALALGSTAAVVGLGIWGAVSLSDNPGSMSVGSQQGQSNVHSTDTSSSASETADDELKLREQKLYDMADQITDDFMTRWEKLLAEDRMMLQQIDVAAVEVNDGSLLFITYPEYKSCGVFTYYVTDDDVRIYDAVSADSIKIWNGKDDILLECLTNNTNGDVLYVQHTFYRAARDGGLEWLCAHTTGEVAGEYVYCGIREIGESQAVEKSYDEYLKARMKLISGYTEAGQKGVTEYVDISSESPLTVIHTAEDIVLIHVQRALGLESAPIYIVDEMQNDDNVENADDNADDEGKRRFEMYASEDPVTVCEGSLRNGSSQYDFKAYIYKIMSETDTAYKGNCAIEITDGGEIVDRNMLLVGYTLGQNGTEFNKNGDDSYFSVIELENGSVLLSTREHGAVTEATLYSVKNDAIVQIERFFADPAEKPERDSSVRSFNLSRSYTTENDDIIFDINGEKVRVTIDFNELTLKCGTGYESTVYCYQSTEDNDTFAEAYQDMLDSNYGEIRRLFDYYHSDSMPWDDTQSFFIEGLPDVKFTWSAEEITATDRVGNTEKLIGGMPIWSVYLTDLNGDGIREICCTTSFGSGIIDDRVVVYDCAAKQQYELSDRGYHDYVISHDYLSSLMVRERDYFTGVQSAYGKLVLSDEGLAIEKGESINSTETEHYTLHGTVMVPDEMGGLTAENDGVCVRTEFDIPSSWICSSSTADYIDTKVFEMGGVWHASHGIDTNSYKTDEAMGAEITVHEEKYGTGQEPYEYFIHTSTPIKYANDNSYDAYHYVVRSGEYYVGVTFISDMGISQETIDGVLRSVIITEEDFTGDER